MAAVQKHAPMRLGKVPRGASTQEGLKALSIFAGNLYTKKDQVPQTGSIFVGWWLLNNTNMPRNPHWSFAKRWHSKSLRKMSSSKGSWALYTQHSYPKKKLHKTNNFIFCQTHKDFLLLSLFLQAKFAEDHQIAEDLTEQGKTPLDAPAWRQHGPQLQKQPVPGCLRFSRFQRTGTSQKSRPQLHVFSQGCELYGQTEPVLGDNAALAPCSCRNRLQTQSRTWPSDQSWQILPDPHYFHCRAGIMITNIIFLVLCTF